MAQIPYGQLNVQAAARQRLFIEQALTRKSHDVPSDPFKGGPIGALLQLRNLQPASVALKEGMSAEEARKVPQAIANPGIYGDMNSLLAPVGAAVDFLAVARPKCIRIMLIIQNPGVGNLFVDFDKQASLQSMLIVPGGSVFFDAAVPQNDIHLFSTLAVNVPVFFMNTDPIHASST